ncbi:2-Cys peroxiredoxin 5 [Brevundimonas alba]|uniref:Glutathione-dependent peroxiredoxin n=1 Tax=Brevundimonas alba TaxID=74314 RepID=A0A7X5YIM5_9CAUL|nr:peroxiredoxin [Brevundimonas alba]NJC40661.1 2-Cys peroxiredoxin 5 [Brevundimonas alba]
MTRIRVGERVPPIRLGRLHEGFVTSQSLETLFQGRRGIVIGVPGAFTPVCTGSHVPDFVERAPQLKASGFDFIACIASNDPWALDLWSRQLDPEGRLIFLSDGNLEFVRKTGLTRSDPDQFLGERCRRFMMILNGAVVEKLSVEAELAALTCTRSADVLLDA